MPISLKLPALDDNPILLAETRPSKISEFIENLPYGDPIRAAGDLVEELQIINSQKVAFSNRINALELYRPAAIQIHHTLIPHFSGASLPLSKNELAFAKAAEYLWQEIAYGYKSALVDLQNKILNINNSKSTALVVQRAIHALKEISFINYLMYHIPSSAIWSELHQLYFCALQQSAEKIKVKETLADVVESSVNETYIQVLLLSLTNPFHLTNADIVKADAYLARISADAELRPLGFIEDPTGIFLINLDSNKPPTAFVKNRDLPNNETDILLVTVNLARRIHTHLKTLQGGAVPSDNSLPKTAIKENYEDLLAQLIKHFGKAPLRFFTRSKRSDGIELAVGMQAAHHFIPKTGVEIKRLLAPGTAHHPSRWQILNVSAGGYALRKFNSSQVNLYVGDIAAIKNSKTLSWELGVLRWAVVNELNQLDAGFELISPAATAINVESANATATSIGLLLPELSALKQTASIIVPYGSYTLGETLTLTDKDVTTKVLITKLVERTATFERFQFSLI